VRGLISLQMIRSAFAALVIVLIPAAAIASLGGTVATVDTDRVRTKSALVGISGNGQYVVHTLQSPTGTIVREYFTPNGVVFGVAWDGAWPPDLRQLLATYFEPYRRAVRAARRVRKARARMAIDDGGLVVRSTAHTGSFMGSAYAPRLLPAGVNPAVVR